MQSGVIVTPRRAMLFGVINPFTGIVLFHRPIETAKQILAEFGSVSATDKLPLFLLSIQCPRSAEGAQCSFAETFVALWHCFMKGRPMLVAFPYERALTVCADQLP